MASSNNIQSKRQTNNCIVKVRKAHNCCCCNKVIKTGETARTINPANYNQPRRWMCMNCVANNKNKYKEPIECCCCGEVISKGQKVRTFNIGGYSKKRKFACPSCASTLTKIMQTHSEMNSVAFGDEGASLALMDYAGEEFSEFIENCQDNEVSAWIENQLGIHHYWE